MTVMGAIAVLLALFFIKSKPEDIGALPDGDTPGDVIEETGGPTATASASKVYKNTTNVPFKMAIKTPAFWLIALGGSSGFFAYATSTSQAVLNFTTQGYDQAIIVSGVAVLGLAMMAGVFLIGMLSDYIEPIRLIGIAAIVLVCVLIGAAFIKANWFVYVYYICIGLGFGSISTNLPTAVANYFGRAEFSKNIGTTMLICGLSNCWVGTAGGAIFDATGSCTLTFIIAGIGVAICCVCAWLVRIPKKA
jgi:predicted MFS family arabinose efflux permease